MANETESQAGSSADKESSPTTQSVARSFSNPVVAIATAILISVFVLFLFSMLSNERDLLGRMSESAFARGLITYLFAVVTIGTAIVLIVFSLTHGNSEHDYKKFEHGKEILSLLLGIFGTIVGFYFGSELANNSARDAARLQISTPLLSDKEIGPGETLQVSATVSGGAAPYQYGVAIGQEDIVYVEDVRVDGWIITTVDVPTVSTMKTIVLTLGVIDVDGKTTMKKSKVRVLPSAGN